MNTSLRAAFAVLAATAPLCSQQLWKVNCLGGPGVHFTDLPPAVAAAAPGDEIWVYMYVSQPCGPSYTAPVIDKPLRITGFTVTPGGSGTQSVNLTGSLVVQNIPAGQRVELSNLSIGGLFTPIDAIAVLDCQGDVLLDNVSAWSFGMPNVLARVERCSEVVLRGCSWRLGGSPLLVLDSHLVMTTCDIDYAAPWTSNPYTQTTETVRVINSTVTAIGSVIWGADDAGGGVYQSRPAVVVHSGTFRVGPFTSLLGGSTGTWSGQTRAYDILNPSLGSVQKDPRGIIQPLPPFSPPPVPITLDATFHSWVTANVNFGVTVAGPANGFAVLAFGDWQPGSPTPLGNLDIAPGSAFGIAVAPLSANDGSYQWTFACPLTAPVAHAYAMQAITLAPNGALGITVASPLTVGWPHGVTP